MKFHHEFTVPAGREQAWAFLMDVPGLASCIPGVENLRPAGPDLWDADVTAKIGPIAARFGCRVQVVSLDEAAGTVNSWRNFTRRPPSRRPARRPRS